MIQKVMQVDYMSSEQSMLKSVEEENGSGYESPDVDRPKKGVCFKHTTLAQSYLNPGHAQS